MPRRMQLDVARSLFPLVLIPMPGLLPPAALTLALTARPSVSPWVVKFDSRLAFSGFAWRGLGLRVCWRIVAPNIGARAMVERRASPWPPEERLLLRARRVEAGDDGWFQVGLSDDK